jgi:hypothetical protein
LASYHLAVKTISRSAGRSATAAAAYRAGIEIADERTGLIHDYTRKQGVEHSLLVLPDDAPDWAADRATLWNAAEQAETRKNSTVAREFEITLPSELDGAARRALALSLANEISTRHGVAVDVAIHAPGREGDSRNHHAHLMLTTRRLTKDGLGEKSRELDQKQTGEVERWRGRWAEMQNLALEQAGITTRVDHRSFARQGLDKQPTVHMGPAIAAIERRAEREAKREDRTYVPVTAVGIHNEMAQLGLFITKTTVWLRQQRQRAGNAIRDLAGKMTQALKSDQREQARREKQAQDRAEQLRLKDAQQRALDQKRDRERQPERPKSRDAPTR